MPHNDQIRRTILRLHSEEQPWKSYAINSNVPLSTAYRWINSGQDSPGPRGGRRNVKVNEDKERYLLEYVENNPQVTD